MKKKLALSIVVVVLSFGIAGPAFSDSANISFVPLLLGKKDCNGDLGGSALRDNCGICIGGDTGKVACEQDCNGDWGGTAYIDGCEICAEGKTGRADCGMSTITFKGHIWLDRNLGASRVATSITDKEAYGDLYQWGRLTDGHEKRTSGTTETLSNGDIPGHGDFIMTKSLPYDWRSSKNDELWQGREGINNPCPAGYRLPTKDELLEAMEACIYENECSLAWTLNGLREPKEAVISGAETVGYYWTSTTMLAKATVVDMYVVPEISMCNYHYRTRAYGAAIRCIKD